MVAMGCNVSHAIASDVKIDRLARPRAKKKRIDDWFWEIKVDLSERGASTYTMLLVDQGS